jgi:hypothetical protein
MSDVTTMTHERYLFWRPLESRWRVHLVSRGCHYEKHFSVKEHGSRERARQAALHWRDQLYATLPHRRIKMKERRNRSGTIGVRLACKTNPSGQQYWSWVALWQQDGRTCSTKFSILKYGEIVARQLAIEAREAGIARAQSELKTTGRRKTKSLAKRRAF